MRIIAGKYKAKRLVSPKTPKTRPTLDRVKEAMFSIIDPYIIDANVLDLFSGTGNLAIESISRGAKFAWINDIENLAISTIIANTQLTKVENCVKITKKDYIKCLNQILKENIIFDVIFLDPPYDSKYAMNAIKIIDENNMLAKDGILVYETDKSFIKNNEVTNEIALNSLQNLECYDEKNYGNVILRLFRWR